VKTKETTAKRIPKKKPRHKPSDEDDYPVRFEGSDETRPEGSAAEDTVQWNVCKRVIGSDVRNLERSITGKKICMCGKCLW